MTKLHSLLAAVATTLLLAACGGSGGDDTPVLVEDPSLLPTSATSSTSAWFKFTSALAPTDSGEALRMGAITELPTSETEEPMPLAR